MLCFELFLGKGCFGFVANVCRRIFCNEYKKAFNSTEINMGSVVATVSSSQNVYRTAKEWMLPRLYLSLMEPQDMGVRLFLNG